MTHLLEGPYLVFKQDARLFRILFHKLSEHVAISNLLVLKVFNTLLNFEQSDGSNDVPYQSGDKIPQKSNDLHSEIHLAPSSSTLFANI